MKKKKKAKRTTIKPHARRTKIKRKRTKRRLLSLDEILDGLAAGK